MAIRERWNYYRRIFSAYLTPGESQLSFWHDQPEINPNASATELGEYYMPFSQKADYAGLDAAGIPVLNYRGATGPQYNPIAIAQWGLGNYNLYRRTRDEMRKRKFLAASDWLCARLELNSSGVWVWNHYFDWEYRTTLKAPWYSGLAQGQGMSLLLRAWRERGDPSYLEAAQKVFASFLKTTAEGGVAFTDVAGNIWFEEYIVFPPTHILNGFMWAMWGLFDYFQATRDISAEDLFRKGIKTLRDNLAAYDLGFWSLYEQSGMRLPMVASPFYHRLHITQLRVMHVLTGDEVFAAYADRWETYSRSPINRARALCYKSAFKLCYY
jgi:heparosan-N-sulfate-glucuronate 5-epimerase